MRVITAAFIAALCLAATPVLSQDYSTDDQTQVASRIADLMSVVESGDPTRAIDVVPPRLYRYMGERVGASEGEVREHLRGIAAQAMAGVEVIDYVVDLEAAEPRLTPDGSRTYLLIPTVLRMRRGGDVIRSESQTLAFEDEGRWGLIRIDSEQQVALLVQVWPEFSGIDFPHGTMTIE